MIHHEMSNVLGRLQGELAAAGNYLGHCTPLTWFAAGLVAAALISGWLCLRTPQRPW